MSHRKFVLSFPWARYSKKLSQKIESPRHAGFFTVEEARERGMRLVVGKQGRAADGNEVHLYFLVDESDGIIADAKFQSFGQSALIGAAEVACALAIRKNYDQARRMTADFIDQQLRDKKEIPAFPEETYPHLNLVIDAIEEAAAQCEDIPFTAAYVPTPIDSQGFAGEGYPGWADLNREQKMSVIEQVIANDIRPYIELDAGGIQVIDFVQEKELIIAYEGACTSCHSATGATLNAIQDILRAKVDSQIVVTPDLSFLQG